jgi:hypothetical protein
MKQTTKNILAKEIVILFSCVAFIGLTCSIFWAKNKYIENQTGKIEKQISKLTNEMDSIQSVIFQDTTDGFSELIKNLYTTYKHDLTEERFTYIYLTYKGKEENFVASFYAIIGEDLTKEKLRYIRNTYLKHKKGRHEIIQHTLASFEYRKKQNEELNMKLKLSKSKIYSLDDFKDIEIWAFILILTTMYPLRFLFLLFRWAVKTLKQN